MALRMDADVGTSHSLSETANNQRRLVSVVISAYNEQENIGELHTQVTRALKTVNIDFEILYVDDGSTDGTFASLLALYHKNTCVKIPSQFWT
jgi:glycosyltransferase involved in cell wall biosynthesis